jgi:anthranilate synthase component 2
VATDICVEAYDYLFTGIPPVFKAGRYHSWVVNHEGLSPDLLVTARDRDGWIMALAHRQYDIRGVQFHPESILTEHAEPLMRNWLNH